MPLKDPEARKLYYKQWKAKRKEKLSIAPFIKKTEEERKESRRLSIEKYHKKNPQKAKEWQKAYTKNNPEKRLLWGAKKRSKDQSLPFDIEESDIIIPTHCPYLKIELTTTATRGSQRTSVYSLDKIVPQLGYVKGNVEVISHLANTMKSNATKEQLIEFAKTILERYG